MILRSHSYQHSGGQNLQGLQAEGCLQSLLPHSHSVPHLVSATSPTKVLALVQGPFAGLRPPQALSRSSAGLVPDTEHPSTNVTG